MTSPKPAAQPSEPLLARRNYILLAAAVLSLVAGYAVLSAGHPSLAAVLLVAGYCVLFPLAIAI